MQLIIMEGSVDCHSYCHVHATIVTLLMTKLSSMEKFGDFVTETWNTANN